MIFSVENLGPIRQADVEIGDLTVVCGRNNNGKTYLTYTLATFLLTIKRNLTLPVADEIVDSLVGIGEVQVNLADYIAHYITAVRAVVPLFRNTLPRFLSIHPDRFSNTNIEVDILPQEVEDKLMLPVRGRDETTLRITEGASIRAIRHSGSTFVRFSLLNQASELPSRNTIADAMAFLMARMFDDVPENPIFPDVFAITCERTGAMLFRNELVKIRAGEYGESIASQHRHSTEGFSNYQRPIVNELNFILDLPDIQKSKSVIADLHPEILSAVTEISGGSYRVDPDMNQVRFCPIGGDDNSLSLPESSSTVRSLAEFYFYVAHKARPGQLLMFDEPELNLHPENQRRMARVLAMLSNAGVQVFITTHSDYIIRELNALIRLGTVHSDSVSSVLSRHGINASCVLSASKLRVYILQGGESQPINFDSDFRAFAVPSFDNTIADFNRLYDDIRHLDIPIQGGGRGI